MRPFEFSLQKVLDYRRMVEDWAKDALIEAQSRRMEAEDDLAAVRHRREQVLAISPRTVGELLDLERYLVRLEDEERAQEALLALLAQEEETARETWIDKRTEAEALDRLREIYREEWQLEVDREEQRALDEWATMRRRAA